jgi:hypothetical protein
LGSSCDAHDSYKFVVLMFLRFQSPKEIISWCVEQE